MATVTGPSSSTDTAVARWDGTTGTVIQDSTVTIDASGNVSGIASLAGSPTTTTQSASDNSTKIATTAYVDSGLSGLALDDLSDCITDYANSSMFLGQDAGVNGPGSSSTATGFQAMQYIGSTAAGNTAFGSSALSGSSIVANNLGTDNTAVGYEALTNNSSGEANTAVGSRALPNNTSGSDNTAIGCEALLGCTSGSRNTALGFNTSRDVTNQNDTTAIGYSALAGATGFPNTAVGSNALAGNGSSNLSGSNNVGIGYQAGQVITFGSFNTIIGDNTAASLQTGSSNIIIGYGQDVPSTSTANYLNIGGVITGSMFGAVNITLANGFKATTQSPGDNSTKLATTAYVDAAAGGGGTVTSVAASGSQGVAISGSPITTSGTIAIGLGNITPTSVTASGTLTGSNLSGTNTGDQTITLTGDVTGSGTGSFSTTIKNNVALAGSPTTTTQSPGDNTTKIATTAFVTAAVSAGGGGTVTTTGMPASGNLTQFSGGTSITNADLSGDVTTSGSLATTIASSVNLSGSPTTTTQPPGDNSTKVATTAFVTAAVGSNAGTVVYNVISGFLPSSITGTHTSASFTLSAGQAADSTHTTYITKSSTTSWAASNGNAINGTDATSSTLANSTTYHIFVCSGASGTGSFVSASLTPTFPSGYNTYSRRVGSFNTNASGSPLPYTAVECEGGATINYLTTQVLDISATTSTSSRTLYTLSVPTGVKMGWLYRIGAANVAFSGTIITSPDETDVAPAPLTDSSTVPGADFSGLSTLNASMARDGNVTTNTSAQIGLRSNAAVSVYGTTRGWKDFRRS